MKFKDTTKYENSKYTPRYENENKKTFKLIQNAKNNQTYVHLELLGSKD
jgi:hypothetical protein